ncbi:protein ENHANCED DISEASE RESISTANCE 2-like isoform X2 [Cornus florida]|uniref:protein ENHANCED DISEASE RESISTANCE 2-like isoform X2 n=1 Tax=Cornus florida TaxID=4283 RepID=UPI00289FC7B9|nr:protein ENHANCED DISEASE RESISTANCE 2-like isoform X2 [Cornus florida]
MLSSVLNKMKSGGGSPESGGSESGSDDRSGVQESFGWVFHLGVNSIGHEFCHLRFLFIRGKFVEMYKRDPHEDHGIKPIRRGVVGHTLMVEELGRRKVNHGDVYVIRFYNRLDETKKGEIACASAGEARKWMEAFDHAKQQAEYELSRGGSTRNKLNMEDEINLEGHRPRVRRYARGLKKLIRIGQGPETLIRQSSGLSANVRTDGYFEGDSEDVIDAHEWKCVCTINGVRILEDVVNSKNGKGVLVKAVAVVGASADTVFEVVLNLDRHQRYEWDTLTGDLELLDSLNGHYDVVYGMFDPRYLTRWHSKRDFVFSRQWFRGQDGTYTILQFPTVHKKRPPKSGYRRIKINPSTWEIRNFNTSHGSTAASCLVTLTLELHSVGWSRWKNNQCSKFEKTVPYALLNQVSGLKAYIGASPALSFESSTTVVHSKISDISASNSEYDDAEVADEFYDAIAADSSSEDDDSDNEIELDSKSKKVKLKNVSWAIASLALRRTSDSKKELDTTVPPIILDPSYFRGSLRLGKDETDNNCWTSPSGTGFMIRGKTYLKDNSKVTGGDPLLKLLAVDWFKVDNSIPKVALHPSSLVQSEAGKRLPFIIIINLQVPARPNYNLVLYYAADRPVDKNSLLGKFVDGTDAFRNSRFKLIPSIVEGYWMVKRAVGTKACLLGKAVTCRYLRQDNFLEIDVDIGSSSVAKSVIGLVLGYVTSIVVDLAILIEGKEEAELPEYILGTVRLNRVRPDSAVTPREI